MPHPQRSRNILPSECSNLDANILSGPLMHRPARVPTVGDELTESGWRLMVPEVEEHRVGRVRSSGPASEDSPTQPTTQAESRSGDPATQ